MPMVYYASLQTEYKKVILIQQKAVDLSELEP